jgi:hypothetical protein
MGNLPNCRDCPVLTKEKDANIMPRGNGQIQWNAEKGEAEFQKLGNGDEKVGISISI